ncbi:MAG: hypothetical protein OXF42_02420 [Candidatus Dadabacteria bacterium]|nr:hypothetical protein [Candidatus Dadabacteria bacterium]MCY4042787.1 hypothetical protein [Candidatus Dadabacteria bacterium]MCY4046952.1 hypothetical protein [Candidatus Dadabacteria bacterium]
MSSRGFLSSLFGSVKEQSRDVYGARAESALFFYVLFAIAAVVVPVAALVGIAVFRMF